MIEWAIAFVGMTLLDFIWAHYTLFLVAKKHLLASLFASGILLCNSVVIIGYVGDHWLILPTAAGAFVGTFIASKWRKAT